MQKVVGSNPISRFFENALHVEGVDSGAGRRNQWETADFGRFRLALVPQTRYRANGEAP
jgi:hypothetical protein